MGLKNQSRSYLNHLATYRQRKLPSHSVRKDDCGHNSNFAANFPNLSHPQYRTITAPNNTEHATVHISFIKKGYRKLPATTLQLLSFFPQTNTPIICSSTNKCTKPIYYINYLITQLYIRSAPTCFDVFSVSSSGSSICS